MSTTEDDDFYTAVHVGPDCDECGVSISLHGPGAREDDRWICERCLRNRRHAAKLKPGFYWVRRGRKWEPARFRIGGSTGEWDLLCEEEGWDYDIDEVGPRIEDEAVEHLL